MSKLIPGVAGEAQWKRSYLAVSNEDFAALRHGAQTEVRPSPVPGSVPWRTPTPVVLYNRSARTRQVLMVMEQAWIEPLGAISEESIAAYGCASMTEFRRLWATRAHGRGSGFLPTRKTWCYRLRRFEQADIETFKEAIFHYLYGPYLP